MISNLASILLAWILVASAACAVGVSVPLDMSTFSTAVKDGVWFVKFYGAHIAADNYLYEYSIDLPCVFYAVPWCKYCKKLAPEWLKFAEGVDQQTCHVAEVNCDSDAALCKSLGVEEAYPGHHRFFKGVKQEEYTYDHTASALAAYAQQKVGIYRAQNVSTKDKSPEKTVEEPTEKLFSKPADDISIKSSQDRAPVDDTAREKTAVEPVLVDTRFKSLLQQQETQRWNEEGLITELDTLNFATLTKEGPWLLEFYAPWCGHCKQFAPVYKELATMLKGQINVGKVNADQETTLAGQFGIDGYPTLFFYRAGNIKKYQGNRSIESLKGFISDVANKLVKEVNFADFQNSKKEHNLNIVLLYDKSTTMTVMQDFIQTIYGLVTPCNVFVSNDPLFAHEDTRPMLLLHRNDYPDRLNPMILKNIASTSVQNFINQHRLPILPQIDASTIDDVLDSQVKNRIVVMGMLDPAAAGKVHEMQVLKLLAEQSVTGELLPNTKNTSVIISWLDAIEWSQYAKDTFAVQPRNLPCFILVLPAQEEYFGTNKAGHPFAFTEGVVVEALKDVAKQLSGQPGELKASSTRGFVVSLAKNSMKQLGTVGTYVSEYPFFSLFVFFACIALIVVYVRQVFSKPSPTRHLDKFE